MPQVEGEHDPDPRALGTAGRPGDRPDADRPRQAAGHGEEPGGHAGGQARGPRVRAAALRAGEGPPGGGHRRARQDLDQARTALDAAQAELQSLEAQVREEEVQLRYHRVAAPTAGIVGDIPVRVGDRVTDSTMLTTVDRPGGLEAYVNVPVERAPRLRVGLPVQILDSAGTDARPEPASAFISPRVDDQTQTVLVKAAISNEEGTLRTAQFVRARIVWETHEGPVVPVLAVSRISGQHFAFVAEDEKGALVARQRPLRVGEIVGNDYVVLEGIKPGDRVVVSGTQFLADGVPVKPAGLGRDVRRLLHPAAHLRHRLRAPHHRWRGRWRSPRCPSPSSRTSRRPQVVVHEHLHRRQRAGGGDRGHHSRSSSRSTAPRG